MSGLFKHVPNLLTGLRLVSAPAIALLLYDGNDRAALGIFALAGLSDAADGFLAKRFGFATRFGRYLDPAADKLLVLVSFVTLAMMNIAPFWLAAIVVGRDLAIILGVILAVSFDLPVRIEPLFIGKASTACQIAYIALALVLRVADLGTPAWLYWAAVATAFATAASWATYGFVLVQGLAIRMRRQR